MTLSLFGHPFSSYTWKALIALYEKGLPFAFKMLGPDHPGHFAELTELWPLGKFPVLEDEGRVLIESSIIIEHLDQRYPDTEQLIPRNDEDALDVRFMDRLFDNHVMTPTQAIVAEHLPFITPTPDPARIDRAKAALDAIYGWLEHRLAENGWACGAAFTLADCAAAPSLFYADWAHEIPASFPRLRAYRARLLARPSVARCVDEARPYRPLFPLGAPARD